MRAGDARGSDLGIGSGGQEQMTETRTFSGDKINRVWSLLGDKG